MRLSILPFVGLLVLAACQDRDVPEVDPSNFDNARKVCERKGGTWQSRGSGSGMICLLTPRDAGKSCSASTDCSTQCLARSKTCAPVSPLFGCNEVLDSRGRASTVCLQ